MRRNNLVEAALAATALAAACQGAAAERKEKPNVLFIAIDDMKPLMGCYGDKTAVTPNIDKLASRSVVFLNNQCQWPVCGPSRASIMTGLRPEHTGVMNLKTKMRSVHPEILTIPQYFKENGYVTVGRGKIFDPRCVEGGRKTDDPKSWSIPYKCPYGHVEIQGKPAFAAPEVADDALTDGKIAKEGVRLIGELSNKEKPFFIAVGFKKPHLPFIAPKKYWDIYGKSKMPVAKFQKPAAGVDPSHNYHNSPELRSYDGIPKTGAIPAELQRELLRGYYACSSYIDAQIGKLIDALKNQGVYDNTIICLWGDHGWHLGDHGMWGKHTTLEQAARAPLIIRAPGGTEGKKTTSPTEFIDVFPTLCDLVGLPIPKQLEGRSLVPIMKNPEAMVKPGAITNFHRKGFGYSFRDKRYRYVVWINHKTKKIVSRELYDYEKDPLETVDFSKNPEYKEIMERLDKELRETAKGGCDLLFETK